jgi:hypothetical protein
MLLLLLLVVVVVVVVVDQKLCATLFCSSAIHSTMVLVVQG